MRLSLKLGIAVLILALSTAAFAAPSICDAVVGNLVTNCGFETGDFTGWTLGGNTGFTGVDNNANSGEFAAVMGPIGSDGTLSQSVVGSGTLYGISFYLANDGGTPNDFTVLWNGNDVGPDLVDANASSYTLIGGVLAGNNGVNTLQFNFRQDPAFLHLDDVTVLAMNPTPTPEPSTLITLGSGLLGLAGLARKRLFS